MEEIQKPKIILYFYISVICVYLYTLHSIIKVNKESFPSFEIEKNRNPFEIPIRMRIVFIGFEDLNSKVFKEKIEMFQTVVNKRFFVKNGFRLYIEDYDENFIKRDSLENRKIVDGLVDQKLHKIFTSYFINTNEKQILEKLKLKNTWTVNDKNFAILQTDSNFLSTEKFYTEWLEVLEKVVFKVLSTISAEGRKTLNHKALTSQENDLTFTLLTAEPKNVVFQWNFTELYELYLKEFFDALNFLNVKVDSQVSLFSYLKESNIKSDSNKKTYYVREVELKSVVKSDLNMHEDIKPTTEKINFVLLIPPLSKFPLNIRSRNNNLNGHSFVIPSSEATTIWSNPIIKNISHNKSEICENKNRYENTCLIKTEHFKKEFQNIMYQIRLLFGLEDFTKTQVNSRIQVVPSRIGITEYEKNAMKLAKLKTNFDMYYREFEIFENLFKTLDEFPFPLKVKEIVLLSMDYIKRATNSFESQKIDLAITQSTKAIAAIHKALIHPDSQPKNQMKNDHKIITLAPFVATASLPVVKAFVKHMKS